MTKGRAFTIATAAGVVVLGGALVATLLTAPSVPEDGALPLVGHTAMAGDIAPDAAEGVDPTTIARSPVGQECLARIERPAGPFDLCWAAWRSPFDGDPDQDYYLLHVYGTFGGETGTGVRWASVRTHLVGQPSNAVFSTWPDGEIDGDCRAVGVNLSGAAEPLPAETVCGRTTARTDTQTWSHRVDWTCASCLLADHANRAFDLYDFVAVAEGTVPTWELYADLGG